MPSPPQEGAGQRPSKLAPVYWALAWLRRHAILLAALLLVSNLLAGHYVARERTPYFWDYVGYWDRSAHLADTWRQAPSDALGEIDWSIRHDEYNLLPAALPAALMSLFGHGRMTYILALTNLYALPAVLGLLLLCRLGSCQRAMHGWLFPALAAPALVLCPFFWAPTLRGYPDVGGLVPIALTLYLYLARPVLRQTQGRLLAIGMLLAVTMLFRRWYAFWCVAFGACLALDVLVNLARSRQPWRSAAVQAARIIGLPAAAATAVVVALSWPRPLAIIGNDYIALYAAYRSEGGWAQSLLANFQDLPAKLGLGLCILLPLSLAYGLVRRHLRRPVLFLTLQTLLALSLFSRVNGLGSLQHYYLLLPAVLLPPLWCLADLLQAPNRRLVAGAAGTALGAALVSLMGLNLWAALCTADSQAPAPGPWRALLARLPAAPLVRHDLPEIQRLMQLLESRALAQQPQATIYVLSGSRLLSSSHLQSAELSLGQRMPASQRVLSTHGVDMKDGFPHRLLWAHFVVLCVPIQYDMRPADQRVISIPAQALLDGRNIGAAFARWPEQFALDGGVKAYVYEKRRRIQPSEVRQLSDLLRQAYPDHPFVYRSTGN